MKASNRLFETQLRVPAVLARRIATNLATTTPAAPASSAPTAAAATSSTTPQPRKPASFGWGYLPLLACGGLVLHLLFLPNQGAVRSFVFVHPLLSHTLFQGARHSSQGESAACGASLLIGHMGGVLMLLPRGNQTSSTHARCMVSLSIIIGSAQLMYGTQAQGDAATGMVCAAICAIICALSLAAALIPDETTSLRCLQSIGMPLFFLFWQSQRAVQRRRPPESDGGDGSDAGEPHHV